jgi:diguanylate cyclase (GGDEF)-like protein
VDTVLIVDPGLAGSPVVAATHSVEELTGFPVEQVVGRRWPPLWDAERDGGPVGTLAEAVANGARTTVALPTQRREGEPLETVVATSPARLDGRAVVFLEITRSVGERERWLAYHDALTGLANRHLLERDLDLALSRAARHGAAVALLYLDLDGFKSVNDELGHAAGDAVLVEVADHLRSMMREEDVVVRLGGDEFVVLLPDVTDEALAVTAHRVRIRLAGAAGPLAVRWSVSVGTAAGTVTGGPDVEQLMRSADLAMYDDKQVRRAGRTISLPVSPAPGSTPATG